MTLRRLSAGPLVVAAAFVIILSLSLAGCLGPAVEERAGGTVAAEAVDVESAAQETVYINIRNFRFHPADIEVRTGTRVVFVNEDDVEHNIMQADSHRVGAEPTLFESPVLKLGQQWAFVFNEAGEYPIICTVGGHSLMGMQGRIVVSDE